MAGWNIIGCSRYKSWHGWLTWAGIGIGLESGSGEDGLESGSGSGSPLALQNRAGCEVVRGAKVRL